MSDGAVSVESVGQRAMLPGELGTEIERQKLVHAVVDKIVPKAYFIVYENEHGALVLMNSANEHKPGLGIRKVFTLVRDYCKSLATGKCLCGSCV